MIMMVNRSPVLPLHLTLGLSFICPVNMVSPGPGLNLGHLTVASCLGTEVSLEGTTWTQSAGFTETGAVLVEVGLRRPGSTLPLLFLILGNWQVLIIMTASKYIVTFTLYWLKSLVGWAGMKMVWVGKRWDKNFHGL